MTVPRTNNSHLTFEQGLLESQESSKLDIGFLTRCTNWVPEPNGALRCRASWSKGSEVGVPATRRNRGIGMFNRFTDPTVVQSTSVYQNTGVMTSSLTTPVMTWATPTTTGSTLVAVVSMVIQGNLNMQFVATGWTARNPIPTTLTNNIPVNGVYELVTTQSYSGAQSPFTFTPQSTVSGAVFIRIFELQGVTGFDQVATAAVTGGANAVVPITVTTPTTTQASEIALAFTSIRRAASPPTPLTFTSATTGWALNGENAASYVTTAAMAQGTFVKTARALGAQAITIDPHFGAVTSSTDQTAVIVTYKGWNTVAVPQDTGAFWLTAQWNGVGVVDIYAVDRPTLATATYSLIDANRPNTGNLVAFTMGMGAAYYTASTFTAGVRRYNGNSAAAIPGSPIGARAIANHLDRMWAAAGTGLYSSAVGDGLTWTGAGVEFFAIGRDDGEPIEDITPFGGGLVIGKRTSIHYLVGTTSADFQVIQQDGGGAAPGRSVLSTPYGCVIAGLEQVWLFDGTQVRPIGRAIQHSYGVAETDFVSTSYIDGVIYIAIGSTGKVFAFDLNAGTWRHEQVGDGDGESPAVLYNYGPTQLYGPMSGTIGSLLNFRTFPDPDRTKDFDPLPETFVAQTGDLALAGVRQPITPRQLFVQLRQRGGSESDPGIAITPIFDGQDGTPIPLESDVVGVRRETAPAFSQQKRVNTVGLRFEQSLGAGENSVTDIEDCYLDFIQESASPTA